MVVASVRAVGGFGGPGFNQGSGDGEDLTAYLPVTPNENLYTEVGQIGSVGGGVGFGGGGAIGNQSNGLTAASSGGGASDVRTCSQAASACPGGGTSVSSRLIVAGGGGGAGGSSPSQFDGCGGGGFPGGANGLGRATTSDGTFVLGIDGTAGTLSTPSRGGTNLGPGAGGITPGCPGRNADTYSGSAAGNAGNGPSGGSGANAPPLAGGGGGAGGGYFGGGGGASGNEICTNAGSCYGGSNGAGGGGGSSFVTTEALVGSFGGAQGNPFVTYTPEIAIESPANGATYTQGQVVGASFVCDAAIFSACTGTFAAGQPVDTSTVGPHTFAVQGTIFMSTVTGTVTYTVISATSTTTTVAPTTTTTTTVAPTTTSTSTTSTSTSTTTTTTTDTPTTDTTPPDTTPPPTTTPTTLPTSTTATTPAPVATTQATTVPAPTTVPTGTTVPVVNVPPVVTVPTATTTPATTAPATTAPPTTSLPATTATTSRSTTTAVPATTTPPPPGATVDAVNPDAGRSGPPGVGLDVSGVGYVGCKTVYVFLDGVRIGTVTPDAGGAIGVGDLSVPGDAKPGPHTLTTSCAPSDSPVRASTTFSVTNDSPHRSAFVTSLPEPGQISLSLTRLAASAGAALFILLLFAFPYELFNKTVEENYDEIRGWFRLPARAVDAAARTASVATFFLLTAVAAVAIGFLSPSFGWNQASLVLGIGTFVALLIMSVGFSLPAAIGIYRRTGELGKLNFLGGSLIVSIVMVVLSRLLHFEPGYFYGALAGLAFRSSLSKDAQARLSAANWIWALGLSVGAFFLRVPVAHAAARPGASVWWIGIEAGLVLIFLWGVEGMAVAMLPMRFLDGRKIIDWNRFVWAALMFIGVFATVHVLLAPSSGYVGHTNRQVAVGVMLLFLIFGAFSVLLWSYFRFRPEGWSRNPGQGSEDEFLGV